MLDARGARLRKWAARQGIALAWALGSAECPDRSDRGPGMRFAGDVRLLDLRLRASSGCGAQKVVSLGRNVLATSMCFHPGEPTLFALGAEGVNMGTRFCVTQEAPIHDNIKQALVDASERDTKLMFRTMRNTARDLVYGAT